MYGCDRFDKVRIPRENMLNAVADVNKDGQYESVIKDPDQVCLIACYPRTGQNFEFIVLENKDIFEIMCCRLLLFHYQTLSTG